MSYELENFTDQDLKKELYNRGYDVYSDDDYYEEKMCKNMDDISMIEELESRGFVISHSKNTDNEIIFDQLASLVVLQRSDEDILALAKRYVEYRLRGF